ncbi:unnamed protein product, partial [Meganyctiphanes norvegica]
STANVSGVRCETGVQRYACENQAYNQSYHALVGNSTGAAVSGAKGVTDVWREDDDDEYGFICSSKSGVSGPRQCSTESSDGSSGQGGRGDDIRHEYTHEYGIFRAAYRPPQGHLRSEGPYGIRDPVTYHCPIESSLSEDLLSTPEVESSPDGYTPYSENCTRNQDALGYLRGSEDYIRDSEGGSSEYIDSGFGSRDPIYYIETQHPTQLRSQQLPSEALQASSSRRGSSAKYISASVGRRNSNNTTYGRRPSLKGILSNSLTIPEANGTSRSCQTIPSGQSKSNQVTFALRRQSESSQGNPPPGDNVLVTEGPEGSCAKDIPGSCATTFVSSEATMHSWGNPPEGKVLRDGGSPRPGQQYRADHRPSHHHQHHSHSHRPNHDENGPTPPPRPHHLQQPDSPSNPHGGGGTMHGPRSPRQHHHHHNHHNHHNHLNHHHHHHPHHQVSSQPFTTTTSSRQFLIEDHKKG